MTNYSKDRKFQIRTPGNVEQVLQEEDTAPDQRSSVIPLGIPNQDRVLSEGPEKHATV